MSGSHSRSIIFGATGVVGDAVVRLLSEKTSGTSNEIIAVSRKGDIPSLAALPGVSVKKGDVLDEQKTLELCEGVSVIYGSVGLPYFSHVWEKGFPKIVESLLKAAEATGAVLVWVDNMYMFGPEAAASGISLKESSRDFTEYGRKPALRSRLDKIMLEAAESGRCKVAIIRGSDFYGPGVHTAMMGADMWNGLVKSNRGVTFGDPKYKHTFTYVPDLARAMIAIAEAGESAWGRAWHCPNAPAEPVVDIVKKAATACGHTKPPTIWEVSGISARFLGLFMPMLRELREMSFMWDHDYIVDHSDFAAKFPDLELPTPLDEGLRQTAEYWRSQK